MALIIEDGTQVANADSYGTLAGLKTFSSKRGTDLASSNTDTVLDAAMIRAMDFVEAKRDLYQGAKVSTTQSLQWPRSSVSIDNIAVATNAIPVELVNAQYFLAWEALTNDLLPTKKPDDKGVVTQESVEGAVSISYDSSFSLPDAIFTKANTMLAPLFGSKKGIRRS